MRGAKQLKGMGLLERYSRTVGAAAVRLKFMRGLL